METRNQRVTTTHEHRDPNSLPHTKCLGYQSLQGVLPEKEWQRCGCNKKTRCGSLWIKKKKNHRILLRSIKCKNTARASTGVVTWKRRIFMFKNLQLLCKLDFFFSLRIKNLHTKERKCLGDKNKEEEQHGPQFRSSPKFWKKPGRKAKAKLPTIM